MADVSANPDLILFARAHLRSRDELAVWRVVAGSAEHWWTGREAAGAAKVSDHAAVQCLRQFASAGIVDVRDTPGTPTKYRWAPHMSYLFGGAAAELEPPPAIDPVCGMPVGFDSTYRADAAGEVVLFCSLRCLVRWRHAHPHHTSERSAADEPMQPDPLQPEARERGERS